MVAWLSNVQILRTTRRVATSNRAARATHGFTWAASCRVGLSGVFWNARRGLGQATDTTRVVRATRFGIATGAASFFLGSKGTARLVA